MDSALRGQVDELGGAAGAANGGFDDSGGRSGDGHDGAVVVGITGKIEQRDAIDRHGGNDRLNDGRIAAFGEVGNAFDER